MKKQEENSHEGITWSEMGKQNVQAEKVYCSAISNIPPPSSLQNLQISYSYGNRRNARLQDIFVGVGMITNLEVLLCLDPTLS